MSTVHSDVVVVGAGFAGLFLLHRLRALGLTTIVVEAGSGVGGTWYWNRYPGARCDIESMQYSYQFDEALQQEWEWSERYSAQPEILRYAEHVADRFDLRRDIQFDTTITRAVFSEESPGWILSTDDGREFRASFCVMATGCLSVPNWPDIDGLESFSGPVYHTAAWPHETVEFHGQRVAVMGTGSSAIQSIPVIARQASQLYVFQRTANYSIPAHNRPSDPEQVRTIKSRYAALRQRASSTFPGIDGTYNAYSALDVSAEEREREYEQRWQTGGLTFSGAFGDLLKNKEANDTAADFVRNKIREIVRDPDVAEKLCPTNIFGGKRVCVDTDYFATYNLDHVRLIDTNTQPVDFITENTIVAGGQRYDIDTLVVATGFDAMTGALMRMDIRGRADARLRSRWAQGPSTYLGLAMSGYPNLFVVTGPGSPSVFTNMLPTIEQHVEWICECLAYTTGNGYRVVEATQAAEEEWWEHCQSIATAGLKATTDSWYMGANVTGKAKVFMPYFGGFPAYCEKCRDVAGNGYTGFAFN